MLEAALLLIAIIVLVGLLLFEGRQDAKARQLEETLDDIHKANGVRDRLRRDAGFAQRVRARFTRELL